MHPDTFDVLKRHGVANTDFLADSIAQHYLGFAVTSAADVDANTRIVDETREALLGDGYADHVVDELNDIIGELTRPMSLVYDKLPAGYSLCSARVRRKTQTAEGVQVIVNKVGRFVSDSPEVVAEYRLEPLVQRLERSIERAARTIRGDVERIPALATHTPGLIDRANQTMRAELPASTQNGGGS